MFVGERIKLLRTKYGVTQKRVADDLQISSNSLQSIEYGRTNPNYENLIKFSHYFRVTPDYLLGFTDIPYDNEHGKNFVSDSQRKLIDMILTLSDDDIKAVTPIIERMAK